MSQSRRLRNLTFHSDAVPGIVHVAVLLPKAYVGDGSVRYPVLYLLHGHGGSYTDWANNGVARIVGDRKVIVVMPDGGYDGFYSDWYGSDIDGHDHPPAPGWETFHIDELIPWVDAHYPTIPSRSGRAIAGLSMGGFGAMSYAARHPQMFAAAGSFSGIVDIDEDWPVVPLAQELTANISDGKLPDNCIWGDPITQHAVWLAHDPTALARRLAHTKLFVAAGNGLPGRYDAAGVPNPGAVSEEVGASQMSHAFVAALRADGIRPRTWFYGGGTHSWAYWVDDLRRFLPLAMRAMAQLRP